MPSSFGGQLEIWTKFICRTEHFPTLAFSFLGFLSPSLFHSGHQNNLSPLGLQASRLHVLQLSSTHLLMPTELCSHIKKKKKDKKWPKNKYLPLYRTPFACSHVPSGCLFFQFVVIIKQYLSDRSYSLSISNRNCPMCTIISRYDLL